jgi:hypothetical protein
MLGSGYFQLQLPSSVETRMELGLAFKTASAEATLMHGQGLRDFHAITVCFFSMFIFRIFDYLIVV